MVVCCVCVDGESGDGNDGFDGDGDCDCGGGGGDGCYGDSGLFLPPTPNRLQISKSIILTSPN